MTKTFIISIFCPDRIGLVSAITGRLFDLGANLGDTTFATLGSGAEFSTVCSISKEIDQMEIEEQLSSLEILKEANIRIEPFKLQTSHGPKSDATHRIILRGGDNPGLVARISEVFIEFEANIVQLKSEIIPGNNGDQYVVNMTAWIPKDHQDACIATIENTASSLHMSCYVEKL